MARTPVLRSILRLAREHCDAERSGISPAELRERRLERRYSRREFLGRAGGVGATIAVAGSGAFARPTTAANSSRRVAIVGAGIAGLNAALTLQDKGIASTVYEASDRIGGRMHSDERLLVERAGQRVLRGAD